MGHIPRSGKGVLREAYQDRGIFMVLGAGVSRDSLLPNWHQLLERIFLRLHLDARLDDDLMAMPASVLASLLEGDVSFDGQTETQREAFAELVRSCLYQQFQWKSVKAITSTNAPDVVKQIDRDNLTLRAVSAMCARRNPDGVTFTGNPRVKAVVTFNYDNLLQTHSRAKYAKLTRRGPERASLILRTVERPSAGSQIRKISVYHVHGLIRFDKSIHDRTKHAPDLMVLTEQDFFDMFNNPTRVSNYALLHLLREHTALFVGLSMDDENLRRLLHYSKKERVRAYATERPGEADARLSLRARRHVALLIDDSSPSLKRARERTLAPLGVHVIWVKDSQAITDVLKEIYNSTREADWADVY